MGDDGKHRPPVCDSLHPRGRKGKGRLPSTFKVNMVEAKAQRAVGRVTL